MNWAAHKTASAHQRRGSGGGTAGDEGLADEVVLLIFPVLILGMGALVQKRVSSQLEKTLELPVVGAEHAPNLIAWLEGQNIVVKPAPGDPDDAIRSQREDVILRIGPDYPGPLKNDLFNR